MISWVDVRKNIQHRGVTIYAYFNNHYAGFGPASVQLFRDTCTETYDAGQYTLFRDYPWKCKAPISSRGFCFMWAGRGEAARYAVSAILKAACKITGITSSAK